MEESYNEIEALVTGELSDQEAGALLERMDADEDLKATYLAYKASHAAFEYQIAEDTRDFVKGIIGKETSTSDNKPKLKVLYVAGIAATILVLIFSLVSVNISHNDFAIADNYGINAIAVRDGGRINSSTLSEAIQAYYQNDFSKSKELLKEPIVDNSLEQDYKSWLELMISLKTDGSNSESFRSGLEMILNNESHEFNNQAKKLNSDLNFFWRKLVVRNW